MTCCMQLYKIADYIFSFENEIELWKDFKAQSIINMPVQLITREVSNPVFGIDFPKATGTHILRDSRYGDILTANDDWTVVNYCQAKNANPDCAVILAGVCSRLARESVILCHGSLIEYNGRGIMFTGNSGIGKTTQAMLWAEHNDAAIINGDKVFLSFDGQTVKAHGSPWKGSSPYCLNKSVELSAIVILGRSSKTKVERLNSSQAADNIIPHIFLPYWDESCLACALETTDNIIGSPLPIFRMKCRPDRESVEMLTESIFG